MNRCTLVVTIELLKAGSLTFRTPFNPRKRGVEWRMVIGDKGGEPDQQLIRTLARAFQWQAALLDEGSITVRQLAERESTDERFIAKHLPLASLSPKIVRAILHGTEPVDLTSDKLFRLKDLPLAWREQEVVLGFAR